MSFGIGLENLIITIYECIRVYNKITPSQDQIDDVQDRLNQILIWLIPIDQHLNTKYGPSKYSPGTPSLKTTVDDLTIFANEICKTFQHFHIATRTDRSFSHLRTARFTASNAGKHMASLLKSLERSTTTLNQQVRTLDRRYLQNQLIKVRPTPPLHTSTIPHPGLRILFIDDRNTSRSILAQGYAQLLRDSTLHSTQSTDVQSTGTPVRITPSHWFISTIHSSGLHIRDTSSSGLSILQDRLNLPNAHLTPGSIPDPIALSSLLDHPSTSTKSPNKRTIARKLKTQMSRGLSNTTFNSYEYIFVFSFRDNVVLQKLRAEVRRRYGAYAAPKGMARVVMLGEYASAYPAGTSTGTNAGVGKGMSPSEIEGVSGNVVGDEARRREWDRVMGRIRVGFRAWLREEMGWRRPV